MEEDESDAYILPLIIPRNKKSSGASSNSVQQNNNLNHAQTTMTTTTSISSGGDSEGEDANHNHLPLPTSTTTTGRVLDSVQVGETGSFTLQVTFQPGQDQPAEASGLTNSTPKKNRLILLSSKDIEAEAVRCQEQLESTRLILSGMDAEAGQLERNGDQLRRAYDEEEQQVKQMEREIQRSSDELDECWQLASKSAEELVSKKAAAKAARTRRFQTECALRELQLSLCRRKLEYSTAKKASKKRADIEEGDDEPMEEEEYEDDDPSHMSDEDFAFMKILNEEEERIEQLTRELDELNRDNSAALAEMEAAERQDMTRQKSRKEMEARIEERRVDCEARRQQLASQMAVLERHNGQLAVLNASRRRERLKEVELLQNQVLIEAARQLEELERAGRDLLNGS